MNSRHRLLLALRLLAREWRAGELRILFHALLVAVTSSTAIDLFTTRLESGMNHQSATFLGADLLLTSPTPVPAAWLEKARELGLRQGRALEFASMVSSERGFQLAAVKAVMPPYPLLGQLRVAPRPFSPAQPTSELPGRGEVWLDSRLFERLALKPGDELMIGRASFRATRVLDFEPGARFDLFGLAPRALILEEEVESTGVVQPGSRLSWHHLFAGPGDAIAEYQRWLTARLDTTQQLVGIQQGRRTLGTALERAGHFLSLAVLGTVLLAGVAVAMAARGYSRRHYDAGALMRCLGSSRADLLGLYLPQLMVMGLAGGVLGTLLGWLAHLGLLTLLAGILPETSPPGLLQPFLGGLGTSLAVLLGFALPPLLQLSRVPPLRVLRQETLPMPPAAWLVYGLALAAIVAIMWRHAGEVRLVLILLAGLLSMLALLGVLALLLFILGNRLQPLATASWRVGLGNLFRHRWSSLGQITAFGLVLMVMASLLLVRTELLENWRNRLPADTPNHFLINILPQEREAVARFFTERKISVSFFYPLVRGRLVRLNNRPIAEAVPTASRNHNVLHRELNLSWSNQLPPDNHVIAGRGFSPTDEGRLLVSVEEKMARQLGLKPGDRLEFNIAGELLSADIISLRSVQWDSFRPNFYILFPPGVLENHPATWMTSFYLPKQSGDLARQLVERFPAITLLELDRIMEQVKRVVEQLGAAIEYLLLFVLAASVVALLAALQSSLDHRLREGALLRALGASHRQLRSAQLVEFLALGFLAGLLAALGTEAVTWLLYRQLLGFQPGLHGWLWLLAPLTGMALVGGSGYLGTRSVVRQSPLAILRNP